MINADFFYNQYSDYQSSQVGEGGNLVPPTAENIQKYPVKAWNVLQYASTRAPVIIYETEIDEESSTFDRLYVGNPLSSKDSPNVTMLKYDDPMIIGEVHYDDNDDIDGYEIESDMWKDSYTATVDPNLIFKDNWARKIIQSQASKCVINKCCPPENYVPGEVITRWPWCYEPSEKKTKTNNSSSTNN